MSKQLSRADLKDIIQTAQKRVDDPETVEPYKSVFAESLVKAKAKLAALDEAERAANTPPVPPVKQERQSVSGEAERAANAPQPEPLPPVKPDRQTPAMTVTLHGAAGQDAGKTVVVDTSHPDYINLKIEGNYQHALIVVETPSGEKKNYLPGQASTILRSLIRDRIALLKKPVARSKCFHLAVALYGGLCLYFQKAITQAALFRRRVGHKINKAFSQVKEAWENQQKSAAEGR